MRYAVLAFLGPLSACATTAGPLTAQPLAEQMVGTWAVGSAENPDLMQCASGQVFKYDPDRGDIVLTELTNDFRAVYQIVQSEKDTLLLEIENEKRVTDDGTAVKWSPIFSSPDAFRWHREDWKRGDVTETVWRRCP